MHEGARPGIEELPQAGSWAAEAGGGQVATLRLQQEVVLIASAGGACVLEFSDHVQRRRRAAPVIISMR